MLTKTSEIGVQIMVYLAMRSDQSPVAPKSIADAIHSSPTYTAKVSASLTRAGLLRAHRGALGGVTLSRKHEDYSLLEIIEACQGKILGDYCSEDTPLDKVCGWHRAMWELYDSATSVLKKHTLADVVACPAPHKSLRDQAHCRLRFLNLPAPKN